MLRHDNGGRTALALILGLGLTITSVQAQDEDANENEAQPSQRPLVELDKDPYPSTYVPLPSVPTAITNVTILDGLGGQIESGTIIMSGGDIVAVGANVEIPNGAVIIDGTGKYLTPGIIDVHSHLGDYSTPQVQAHADGNEATAPNTAEVWAEHSVIPTDPSFQRALAGGVTAMQVLPGSANLFGGRGTTFKNIPSRTMQGMKFPGAPYGLKMACGENPKRVYGSRGRSPSTLMGNVFGYRSAWINAQAYQASWENYYAAYAEGKDPNPPKQNLQNETLMGVLEGEILIHNHCYRADEMVVMIDIAKEFGYKITAFHHAIESYKIADILAEEGICSAMWADWGGFKMEAYDVIRENIPFVHNAGACAIVHSDSADDIQRLHQEAAKAVADARRAGLDISMAEAWQWLSLNPARALGIDDQTGSLQAGLDADVVLWSGSPFSVYTRAEQVYIDGALIFDLDDPAHQPVSDFRLGNPGVGDVK
jgi:imidazolonepropionase-like amidohydrolase